MTTAKGIFIGLFALVLTVVTVIALYGFGVWGTTVVERKAFEESYQRSESLKSRLATERATLAEIEAQLSRADLDSSTRANLEAQARAIRVRIRTVQTKQD